MALNIYLLYLTHVDNNILQKVSIQLSDQIQNKIAQYHFAKDKWRALLSEILLRKTLSKELNVGFKDLEICTDEHLKPYLNNFKRQFNLSHSNNLIILATDDTPIGIDIEYIKPLEDLNSLTSCFSKNEQKAFFSKSKEKQLDFFYTLWTLKESYIKAIGKGFNYPLDSFTIDVAKENISLTNSMDFNASWNFKCYEIPEYKCAVCATHNQFPKSLNSVKTSDLLQLFL